MLYDNTSALFFFCVVVYTQILLDYSATFEEGNPSPANSERIIKLSLTKTSFTFVKVLLNYYPQHLRREILHRQISERIIESSQTKTSFTFVQFSYNYTDIKNIIIIRKQPAMKIYL